MELSKREDLIITLAEKEGWADMWDIDEYLQEAKSQLTLSLSLSLYIYIYVSKEVGP